MENTVTAENHASGVAEKNLKVQLVDGFCPQANMVAL
jgi:hypothetical protein